MEAGGLEEVEIGHVPPTRLSRESPESRRAL